MTRTPPDAELCHYPQLFQSYMTLLVGQRADCICRGRTERETAGSVRKAAIYLILTINPARHEKHCDGEADKAVAAELLEM